VHRRLFHWVRATLPSPTWVALFFFAVLAIEGLHYGIVFLDGKPFPVNENPFSRVRAGLAMFVAIAYGLFRVLLFHPLYSSEYRQWLELTPWTVRHPLPCGPARLVPQDGVVMAVLAATAHGVPEAALAIPFVVVGAYLLALTPSFFVLGRRHLGYVTLLGLILAIRFSEWPLAAGGCLFTTYVLAAIGLQRTLIEFPWTGLPEVFQQTNWAEKMADQKGKGVAGWPWDLLNPRREFLVMPFVDAVWIASLVGLGLHAADVTLLRLFQPRNPLPIGAMFFAYGILGGTLTRLSMYITSFAPPINLWGRIGTLRLIIPSYDVVFVGPLLGLAAYGAGVSTIGLLPLRWSMYLAPLGAAVATFFLLHSGPNLRRWELLGRHRVVARGLAKQRFLEL
jgi:hypothetical protein